ncbi:glycoside hydrolase superfamily [Piptocephalis cylindrospora]|uniref:Glycoside hydrolase superfamily n=1 Tax=Piptocephalis cylindrospora TaxID=1907219 RepID=A0A4P9Y6I4_9FUNG|nr:glycoside hydrolase superfamily [Piptocephalis cylindrospora]|eukprot:RKP14573.1 glycoside hydrolase superfamily [Piptocephalis cylindrospora]
MLGYTLGPYATHAVHYPHQAQEAGGTPGNATAASRVIVAYYADWTSGHLAPSAIPYSKLTHINYAFALPRQDGSIELQTPELLNQVVSLAHASNVRILLSLGGWTGSRYFSSLVALAESRSRLIQSILSILSTYRLDGIDVDWEYPGREGMVCNQVDRAKDTPNFLLFLTELRKALAQNMELTLAVRVQPFDGVDSSGGGGAGPLSDVSAFEPLLTRLNLMAYDINGIWSSTTGPNAPLHGPLSGESAVQAWVSAGIPASKLTLGVPFYGRSLTATSDLSSGTSMSAPHSPVTPQGDPEDALWADPCPGAPSAFGGIWQWRLLRGSTGSGGDAAPLSVGPTNPSDGWLRFEDRESETPWLYRPKDKRFISYDDPVSLGKKVQWAKSQNLAGIMLWDLHQDNGELIDALQPILR